MILSVDNVTFGYRKNIVFKEADLNIMEQGIYGLVAPNGAGKTTLLQLIVGLYQVESGNISILDSNKINAKQVSFVQDNSVLYPYLSGYDHLMYICKTHGISKENITEQANKLGMDTYFKDKVSTYSLGMKQRLLLAMGLIKEPKLLLLDEPLNGLDPTSTILIRETLKDVAEKGTTVLVSSHNLAEMDRITDNVFFIKNNKIIEENLSTLKEEKLSIELEKEDIEKAIEILKSNGYPLTVEENKIYIPLKNITAHEIIQLFVQENLYIHHIETSYMGAESRYRALFEEEFSNEK